MSKAVPLHHAGWDIGGAHVKLAYIDAGHLRVAQWSCPLWQGLHELTAVLKKAFAGLPATINCHRVTMTAELADIFLNRNEGVRNIIHAFEETLPHAGQAHYFSACPAGRGLVNRHTALANPTAIASANWIASGKCVSRTCANAVFVDIGSTTADVLPIVDGELNVRGRTDFERLRSGELVYTGVVRTCVNTLCGSIFYKNRPTPFMAENFAASADIYRILDWLPRRADCGATADGRPKDKISSLRRLARMVGEDYQHSDINEWQAVAEYLAARQKQRIKKSIQHCLPAYAEKPAIIGAGVGRFLIRQIAAEMALAYAGFADIIMPENIAFEPHASDCAAAIALLFE